MVEEMKTIDPNKIDITAVWTAQALLHVNIATWHTSSRVVTSNLPDDSVGVYRRIFVYTFCLINICLSLSDDANKINTLNIERA